MLGHLWMCHWPDHRGKKLQRILYFRYPFVKVPYYIATEMDKQQKLERICIEVFEDTVKHACGIDSEPSNKYSAAIRNVLIQWFKVHTVQLHKISGMMCSGLEDMFNALLKNMPISITGWNEQIEVLFHLCIFSRALSGRPAFDASRAITWTHEHCLQPVLNRLVPFIMCQDRGWEDFTQSPFWNTGTGAIWWDHNQEKKKPLTSLLGGIRTQTKLSVKLQSHFQCMDLKLMWRWNEFLLYNMSRTEFKRV